MRRSIIELLDRLENERGESQVRAQVTAEHRLGAAMLDRLGIPEDIDRNEIVEQILLHWQNLPEESAEDYDQAHYAANDEDFNEADAPDQGEPTQLPAPGRGTNAALPRPIRGRLGEAPAADYEGMSAEQFRRLKKQLQRAASDGRRVRL